MVSFRNFLTLAAAASAVFALPAQSPRSANGQTLNVATGPSDEKRAARMLLDRLHRKRAARDQLGSDHVAQAFMKRQASSAPASSPAAPSSSSSGNAPQSSSLSKASIAPYDDLTATSNKPGGLNYTGYKNPVPANKPGNDPHYVAFSAFDWHSLNLAAHQEYIELDLFNYIIAKFSPEEFYEYGLTDADISLLQFYGQQEIGHALVVSNLLGAGAPLGCTYAYNFTTVGEAFLFSEEVTRFGESGVYGFIPSMDNRATAQILLQSITTEARQEFTTRQWLGLQPSPVWFETAVPQTFTWSLMAPWIKSCPAHNTPVGWTIFPTLEITNNPKAIIAGQQAGGPAITHNYTALSKPGDVFNFEWHGPGETVGPYNQVTEILSANKNATWVAWTSQYNTTYSPLENVTQTSNSSWKGSTRMPGGAIFPANGTQSIINETVFVTLTSDNAPLSPLNISAINDIIVAGPQLFFAD